MSIKLTWIKGNFCENQRVKNLDFMHFKNYMKLGSFIDLYLTS